MDGVRRQTELVATFFFARGPPMFASRTAQKFSAFLIFLLPTLLWCQANVKESLETASIYVDGTKGSDSNPGSQSEPLKTISAAAQMALNNNYQSIGSKVIINPGTYREAVSIGKTFRTTSLPITFGAATPGTVIAVSYTHLDVYKRQPLGHARSGACTGEKSR